MQNHKSEKARILWIAELEFSSSPHKTRLIEMISNLQQDFDIHLLTVYRNEKVQPKVFQNEIIYSCEFSIPYLKRFSRYVCQRLAAPSLLKRLKPDILIMNCSNLRLFKYCASRKQKYNYRLIFDVRTLAVDSNPVRNWLNSRLLTSCLRYAAKHFDGMTYITDQMKQYCIKEYGLAPHASAIWTSGVNPEMFSPSKVPSEPHPFTILYHGYVSRQRRIDNAVKAMSLLRDIDVRLNVLGDGDAFENLKELVKNLGIEKQVSIERTVDYEEVPERINRSDIGILPFNDWHSWNVSSPIKLFEYLACGKPVVVTEIPAHRNVLKDAECAFWAKESSPEHVAMAIRNAYDKRRDFDRLSREARELVLREYTWQRQAEKLGRFCDSLLSNNDSSSSA